MHTPWIDAVVLLLCITLVVVVVVVAGGSVSVDFSPGWAHVVCALYIPEVEFANVSTMEPIVLQSVPHERYNKVSSRLAE